MSNLSKPILTQAEGRAPVMAGMNRNELRDSCRSLFYFYLFVILAGLLIFVRPVSAFASGTISPNLQYASVITQPTFTVQGLYDFCIYAWRCLPVVY